MLCLQTGRARSLGSAANRLSQETGGLVNELQSVVGERLLARPGRARIFLLPLRETCVLPAAGFLAVVFFLVVAMRQSYPEAGRLPRGSAKAIIGT